MNNTFSKTTLLLAAVLAAGLSAIAAESTNAAPTPTNKPAAKPLDLFANDIVAQGNGVKVTRTQLDEAAVKIKVASAARGQAVPPQQMKRLEAQLLSELIATQLLNTLATPEDKAKAAELAGKQLETIKEGLGSEEGFQRQLKTAGMTLAELTQQINAQATARTVLEREIKFEVTDAEVKKFYDENPGKFEQPEQVRAAHVLIGTKDKDGTDLTDEQKAAKRKVADDVAKRAKAGEDFAKLVRDYSEDPGSKDKGGEYTFPRGQMVPEFEAAAFAMETNQVSDVITTQFGYHIIKLLAKTSAKKIEFTKAEPDIKQYLKSRGMQKLIPAYIEKVEKAAGVEILDKDLKGMIDEAMAAEKKAETDKADAKKEDEKK